MAIPADPDLNRKAEDRSIAAMVIEIAQVDVIPGQEQAFVTAYSTAREYLTGAEGCLGSTIMRGVQERSRFTALNFWTSVEAHFATFRETPRYAKYSELLTPYLTAPPVVEHYAVLDGLPVPRLMES